MSFKRSYLDVHKVLWAVLFNFCFKEDKGIAALPRKEMKTQKIPPQHKSSILMRKICSSVLMDGSTTENARGLKAEL